MGYLTNYIANYAALSVGREPKRPLVFTWYITHRCALDCPYCPDRDTNTVPVEHATELSTSDSKKLLNAIRRSTDTLNLTGGEPLLRDDLEEILTHAKKIGLRVVLNTRGLGLEKRPRLMELSDILVLSFDTLDVDSLAAQVRKPRAVAEQLLRGLEYAMNNRKKTNTKLLLSSVATLYNLDDVASVLAFTQKHAIGFTICPVLDWQKGKSAVHGNGKYEDLINHILQVKSNRGSVLGIKKYLKAIRDFDKFRCHPLLIPAIRPDGKVYYPCQFSRDAEFSLAGEKRTRTVLSLARRRVCNPARCTGYCHVFGNMATSLIQRRPLDAISELLVW